jgi:methyl-accepting chemotaxis protein/hemerythrin
MSHHRIEEIFWRDNYAIGVADIDLQHQRLLFLLNKLNALINDGKISRKRLMLALLEDFNEYANHHFVAEEALMTANLTADDFVRNHLAAHQAYWHKIPELTARYQAGDVAAAFELVDYLNSWWMNHILGTDQTLGRRLNSHGID